jgi:hypothetical protein
MPALLKVSQSVAKLYNKNQNNKKQKYLKIVSDTDFYLINIYYYYIYLSIKMKALVGIKRVIDYTSQKIRIKNS